MRVFKKMAYGHASLVQFIEPNKAPSKNICKRKHAWRKGKYVWTCSRCGIDVENRKN